MENKKEQLLKEMKDGILSLTKDSFIKNHKDWQKRINIVNSIISINKDAKKYTFNEFCKKSIKYIDEYVENLCFDDFYLNESDVNNLFNKNKNKDINLDIKNAINKKTNIVYFNIRKHQFIKLLEFKTKDKFHLIQNTLDVKLDEYIKNI